MVQYTEENYSMAIESEGTFEVKLEKMTIKENEAGTNTRLNFLFKTLDGEMHLWEGLNIVNKNEKTVEIAYGALLRILKALGDEVQYEVCKNLEPKAETYNELFEMIITAKVLDNINTKNSLILKTKFYQSKTPQFNALTQQEELITSLKANFYPKKKDEPLKDEIPF